MKSYTTEGRRIIRARDILADWGMVDTHIPDNQPGATDDDIDKDTFKPRDEGRKKFRTKRRLEL